MPATEHPLKGTGGARGGFDSADTGRLLIALKVLDQVTNQEFKISKIVKSWDLGASIIDGKMHDILGRTATSVHKSSYAQYAAQGYRLWGYPVLPIYAEAHPLANMDATLRFMEELQQFGRIATEPITTEQIEVGSSDHGTLAADLLLRGSDRTLQGNGHPDLRLRRAGRSGPMVHLPGLSVETGWRIMGS